MTTWSNACCARPTYPQKKLLSQVPKHFVANNINGTGNIDITTDLEKHAVNPAQQYRSWQYLRLFNYYRSALALLFLILYLNGWTEQFIHPGDYNQELFYWASLAYVAASIGFMLSLHLHKPGLDLQVILQTCVDIAVIITLMHASGGIRSGLGMLLIINLSLTSIFLTRRMTLFLAAATSLALLGEHIYSQLIIPDFREAYVQTGTLGIVIFSFTLLTSIIARRLRESEQLANVRSRELKSVIRMNEQIIRKMRTGILVVGPDGTIVMANDAAKDLLGLTHIPDDCTLEQLLPELHERYLEWKSSIEYIQHKPVQQRHGLPDLQPGFSRIEPALGERSSTLVFIEDATQLIQRFQQVRLASLGRLTASIAHEIRNPLAAIHHASQLLDEVFDNGPDKKLTDIIHTQVNRLNGVVENVLQLSRQQRGHLEHIELLPWLHKFADEYIASQGLGKNQLKIHIEPDQTTILFDASHLHQIMWNLCGNAVNHSGRPLDSVSINIQGGIDADSNQPYLDVIDNGPGIDPDTAQQIFDPFFTTSNDGTGLGLYIIKEVVESNRAKIRHIALPAGGTCFRIYFLQAPGQQLGKVSSIR
ncbi:MAG: PAS domain-containing protein [Gammaproteobacteria bacterium]|nr:PAS domain-containing protein [Gammaproteobacteria bacterium]NNL06412.1 PAS domain-containing protein [Gammaproteobacteria bacterium]